jgi:large subunit ribosomal protein L15
VQQHELRPPRGSKKNRKRVGRGNASGHGTYAGKGMKGQQARAGSGPRPGFEGGQTPLIRRLPVRRGFRNPFRVEFTPVNLRDLSRFAAEAEVTPESLKQVGLIHSSEDMIKVLGDGDLTSALTVRVHRVSAPARAKIEAAGGSVQELMPRPEPKVRKVKRRDKKAAVAKKTDEAEATEEQDGDSSKSSESADTE